MACGRDMDTHADSEKAPSDSSLYSTTEQDSGVENLNWVCSVQLTYTYLPLTCSAINPLI